MRLERPLLLWFGAFMVFLLSLSFTHALELDCDTITCTITNAPYQFRIINNSRPDFYVYNGSDYIQIYDLDFDDSPLIFDPSNDILINDSNHKRLNLTVKDTTVYLQLDAYDNANFFTIRNTTATGTDLRYLDVNCVGARDPLSFYVQSRTMTQSPFYTGRNEVFGYGDNSHRHSFIYEEATGLGSWIGTLYPTSSTRVFGSRFIRFRYANDNDIFWSFGALTDLNLTRGYNVGSDFSGDVGGYPSNSSLGNWTIDDSGTPIVEVVSSYDGIDYPLWFYDDDSGAWGGDHAIAELALPPSVSGSIRFKWVGTNYGDDDMLFLAGEPIVLMSSNLTDIRVGMCEDEDCNEGIIFLNISNDHEWHDYRFDYDLLDGENGTVRAFFDGVEVGYSNYSYIPANFSMARWGSFFTDTGEGYLADVYYEYLSRDSLASDYYWDNWTYRSTDYPQTPTTNPVTDYVRYYDFDEGSGTDLDDKSSNDADLTLSGSTGWTGGIKYYGYDFTASDEASSTDLTGIEGTTGTIAQWIYINSDTGAGMLPFSLSSNTTSGSSYLYTRTLMDSSDRFTASVLVDGSTKWAMHTDTNSLDPYVGKWLHVALVHNGTEPSIYFNGELQPTTFSISVDKSKWFDDITTSSKPVDILTVSGRWSNGALAGEFDGIIDETRVYTRNLSSSELIDLYDYRDVLQRYYDFNEGTGTTLDDLSVWDADLTLNDATDWDEGKNYYGFHFDGSTDYASSTELIGLEDDTVGSICGWFLNDDDSDVVESVFTISDSTSSGKTKLILNFRGDGSDAIQAVMKVDNTEQWRVKSTTNIDFGNWMHVCIVQDGTHPSLYINGVNNTNVLTDTDLTAWIVDLTGATDPADTITVGANLDSGSQDNFFDGVIDEVRVYSKALTQAEINSLFGTTLPNMMVDSREATYGELTTNLSFNDLLANYSNNIDSITTNFHNLGANNNYTTWTMNYAYNTNLNINIENNNFMTSCYGYNPYPFNNLINLSDYNLLFSVQDTCNNEGFDSHDYNFTGLFRFDEGSGTVSVDSFNNSLNFTGLDSSDWVTSGVNNSAYRVNGDATYDTQTFSSDHETNSFSVCFWLKNEGFTGTCHDAIQRRNSTDTHWAFRLCQFGTPKPMQWKDRVNGNTLTINDMPNSFNHVCGTYNHSSTTAILYKNGAEVTRCEDCVYENTYSGYFRLTEEVSANSDFVIDEFYYLNRTLTAREVKNINDQLVTGVQYCASNYISCTPTIDAVFGAENTIDTYPSLLMTFLDENTRESLTCDFEGEINHTRGFYGLEGVGEFNTQTFYIFPPYGSLNYSQIQIDYFTTTSGYGDRTYYLLNGTLDNSTESINLYLVDGGSDVTFTIYDSGYNPVIGVLVQALKYFPSEDTYELVTVGVTDDNGKVVMNLDIGDWYRIIVYHEGSAIVKRLYIDTTSQTIVLDPVLVSDWINLTGSVTANFGYNRTTNYTWVNVLDPHGLLNNATFVVTDKSLIDNDGRICDITNYSAGSFYIFCYMGNDTDKIYHVYSKANFNSGYEDLIYNSIIDWRARTDYKINGLIMAFFIMLVMSVGGMMISEVVGLFMFFLSLIINVNVDFLLLSPVTIGITGLIVFILYSIRRAL